MSLGMQYLDNQLLEDISFLYEVPVSDFVFLTSNDDNFIYEFKKGGKNYILRSGTRDPVDFTKGELNWILYLDANGVKVSVPIQSINGNYLELIENRGLVYSTIVFEKALGKAIDIRDKEMWNEKLWEEMGRTMGKIHTVSAKSNVEKRKFKRPSGFKDEYARIDQFDQINDAAVIKKLCDYKENLHGFPRDDRSFGLIHYDFHIENFFSNNGDIIVFDWNDSHYFFFLYDLAASFHETIWDNPLDQRQKFADRFIPCFWRGYSSEYLLDREWLDYLPDFFRWRDYTIYGYLIKNKDDRKHPEKLRELFTLWTAEFRERIIEDTHIANIPREIELWFPE